MRTPVLILPVKAKFCGRGEGGGCKIFTDVLYDWPLTEIEEKLQC